MVVGEQSIVFAADTCNVSRDGHISRYLGTTETVYLQIPTLDGLPPRHKIVHIGPCTVEEVTGI
jgi:hypothetical protein